MTSSRNQPARRPLAAALTIAATLVALFAAACSGTTTAAGPPGPGASAASPSGDTTGTTAAVTRLVYGSGTIPGLPGRELDLMRVVVQPGAHLAMHRHPGTQIARVESGELTYTIVRGEASLGRANGEKPTETVGPGHVVLRAGDTVYENEDLVHFADNKGTVPVVISLASLFASGEPLSIPVDG